jgi:hypothetical protein
MSPIECPGSAYPGAVHQGCCSFSVLLNGPLLRPNYNCCILAARYKTVGRSIKEQRIGKSLFVRTPC